MAGKLIEANYQEEEEQQAGDWQAKITPGWTTRAGLDAPGR